MAGRAKVPEEDVYKRQGYGWGNFSGGHGSKTAATFFQVAPKARLVQLSKISRARTGKDCYCGLEDDCLPYIEEYGITSIFCSFDMICDKYLAQKYQTVIDGLGTFNMFVAAGNEYSTDYVELARCDAVTTVGAYYIGLRRNNPAGSRSYKFCCITSAGSRAGRFYRPFRTLRRFCGPCR